jgi:F-type H+-transporting ATPase subunit epsilon
MTTMPDSRMHLLQCVIVSPERALFDEKADFVVVPMTDGELGVLPGRAPLLGRLGYGEMRVKYGVHLHRFFVDGGFVQVRDNVVTVLTSRAMRAEDIKPEAARRHIAEAHANLLKASGTEAQEAQLRAKDKGRAELRVIDHVRQDAAEGHT